MALKFGRIDAGESGFEEQTFHKNQTLTSASVGVNQHFGHKDSYTDVDTGGKGVLTQSGSHWAFVHTMFYSSGSSKINADERDKFNSIYHNFNQYNDLKPYHNNKFHDTASIIYIPQQYFGERIQPGSFELVARTGSASSTTKQIIIKDDKNGNLYSTNAHYSSSTTHLSSSDNYVGNVLYDLGIAIITETGSWSGSSADNGILYKNIGSQENSIENTYRYWNLNFNSTTPIFTSQYSVKIPAGEFNTSMNASIKPYNNGDYIPSGSSIQSVGNMRAELTTGSFSPYMTQIQFYRNQTEEPVLIANLPRPVQVRKDVDIIITFRVDH
tara:strand:+ start:1236 stop:2216 length:981 start_codon:yes stop_codon:yes gene_type:complete